jgi:hypothetical protein
MGTLLASLPVAAQSGELQSAAAGCPGYTYHLRNARAYLERSDRPAT